MKKKEHTEIINILERQIEIIKKLNEIIKEKKGNFKNDIKNTFIITGLCCEFKDLEIEKRYYLLHTVYCEKFAKGGIIFSNGNIEDIFPCKIKFKK